MARCLTYPRLLLVTTLLAVCAGESQPVIKAVGHEVTAGTVNCGKASLEVRVAATAADSTPARLAALMQQAMSAKSRREVLLQRFAKVSTLLAGAWGCKPSHSEDSLNSDESRVLIVFCSSPLCSTARAAHRYT